LKSRRDRGVIEERTATQGSGDDDDAPTPQIHPTAEAFAAWFADWWLRRGRDLLAAGRRDG
jgi:hypothetical protein